MGAARTRGVCAIEIAAVLALTAAACGGTETTPTALPLPAENVEVGVPYEFELLTHCGIEYMRLDGRVWKTERRGGPNAPDGFADPAQPGIVTLESEDRAVFVGERDGSELVFTPTDEEPPLCA